METAVHDTTKVFIEAIKQIPTVETETENDELISSLYQDPRYEALKGYIDTLITQLDNLEGIINQTDSPEEIGFRYMIAKVARTYLKTVRDLPEVIANVRRSEKDRDAE